MKKFKKQAKALDLKKTFEKMTHSKINAVVRKIEENKNNGKKKLVFCLFIKEMERLQKVLEKKGISCGSVSGSTPKKMREQLLRKPEEGEESPDVLIVQIQTAWQQRPVVQRVAATHLRDLGQGGGGEVHGDAGDQSRSRDHLLPDGVPDCGPAEHGIMGKLWTGQGERRSAGFRGHDVQGQTWRATPLRATVGKRLSSHHPPGSEIPERE